MTTNTTINAQIAGALGAADGSYELLLGGHICDALGIEPTDTGQLIPTPAITPDAAAWLRNAAAGSGADTDHAAEVLAALKL